MIINAKDCAHLNRENEKGLPKRYVVFFVLQNISFVEM